MQLCSAGSAAVGGACRQCGQERSVAQCRAAGEHSTEHNNGCATGSAPVDDVEALGDGAGEWSVEADIPEERFRTAAAAVGDYLYVFGGQAAESTSCEGQDKRAKFPTSKAPISAVFHSFRLIFGRAIISRNGLEAWTLFPERARAEHSH